MYVCISLHDFYTSNKPVTSRYFIYLMCSSFFLKDVDSLDQLLISFRPAYWPTWTS